MDIISIILIVLISIIIGIIIYLFIEIDHLQNDISDLKSDSTKKIPSDDELSKIYKDGKLTVKSIDITDDLSVGGDLNVGEDSSFGNESKRPLKILRRNDGNNRTYFSFYQDGERRGYLSISGVNAEGEGTKFNLCNGKGNKCNIISSIDP